MDLDKSICKFNELKTDWILNKKHIDTEQDARFQVINRILTEILGWNHGDVKTEVRGDSGYVDYLIRHGDRNRLVIEAKRVSTPLIDTKNTSLSYYKINGPALRSSIDGVEQARGYCGDNGVQFAALTTGFQWVAFLAIRSDGKPPNEGKAIVFPSMESIFDNFATFYDLFSSEGVLQRRYQYIISKAEGLSLQIFEILKPAIPDNQVKLQLKSKLALDLEVIFREFFSNMSGAGDPEMLAKCFVESKESREADISLQKIASNLINDIELVVTHTGNELERHIENAVEKRKGEFVLIVGNKGAGKTTYIDRFFRLVLDKQIRSKCLVIRVDMADSSGDISTISKWLTDRLKEEIETNLFNDGIPEYDELQGIYYKEYNRWRTGEYKHLYDSDKTQFKIKFGEYVSMQATSETYTYVLHLLKHSVVSRRLMPCLVFDNTDHFPQDFQESVFQFAQSIHRPTLSFIICPITDRSIWQLSKSGPPKFDTLFLTSPLLSGLYV